MTFIIIAIIILILLLAKKYIARLEPAGVFAAMWVFFAGAVLLLQNQIEQRQEGQIFVLVSIVESSDEGETSGFCLSPFRVGVVSTFRWHDGDGLSIRKSQRYTTVVAI